MNDTTNGMIDCTNTSAGDEYHVPGDILRPQHKATVTTGTPTLTYDHSPMDNNAPARHAYNSCNQSISKELTGSNDTKHHAALPSNDDSEKTDLVMYAVPSLVPQGNMKIPPEEETPYDTPANIDPAQDSPATQVHSTTVITFKDPFRMDFTTRGTHTTTCKLSHHIDRSTLANT